jgi:hypothetical protein
MDKIFSPILEEIEMSDEQKINKFWLAKHKIIINQEFEVIIQKMKSEEESDCDVTDKEAEKLVKERLKEHPKASRKASITEMNKFKEKKVIWKKEEKLAELEVQKQKRIDQLIPPLITLLDVPIERNFYEEVKEEMYLKLLSTQHYPLINQIQVFQ